MPRPIKRRKVCQMPLTQSFIPEDIHYDGAPIVLTVDEYEAIRLIDKECLSQEECGAYMNIARTTVQQIYTSARKKIADALVDALPLRIEGGEYQICGGDRKLCGCGTCNRHRRCCQEEEL